MKTLMIVGAFLTILGSVDIARAQQPSFDCRLARSPTEIAICSDARLSELDGIGGVAFNAERQRPGSHELIIAVQNFLMARIACRSDKICILDNLVENLQLYQRWNIPIVIPDWFSNTGPNSPGSLQRRPFLKINHQTRALGYLTQRSSRADVIWIIVSGFAC